MKSNKQTILAIVGLALILAIQAGRVYLFEDDPYPSLEKEGLITTTSSDILRQVAETEPAKPGAKNITARGEWFVDPSGRAMILHGINVGGSTKAPFAPRMGSHIQEGFYESAYTVSFTGRPFPLEQADEHFSRLYRWGYRFIRLLITWEAIEHAGPGIYDEEYLNYLQALVQKAGEHHLNVFIDPHQDVWSRFTGGDGAPYWTLEKVGFEPRNFSETGAAFIHNVEGDPFPRMIWPTNHAKLGSATMFTLFFAGDDFAPQLAIDGLSAREYLQTHYINAIRQVALKLRGMPNVIGFDTFNEPGIGYIGIPDLHSYGMLLSGVMPSLFEGMVAGGGNAVEVGRYEFRLTGPKELERVTLNPDKRSAWKDPSLDIWRNAGVWGYDAKQKPALLKPDYFTTVKGRKVNFPEDYLKPFILQYQQAILAIDSTWLIFAEPAMSYGMPEFSGTEAAAMVNAGHWYDIVTLLMKDYYSWLSVDRSTRKLVLGKSAIRKMFHAQLNDIKAETAATMGQRPTLIGEFGIPFDLDDKSAYRTLKFPKQEAVLNRSFLAMESNNLSYTLWNYTADNDAEHGDQWNGEDLSIYNPTQYTSPDKTDSGGRALRAAIRAYPHKVAGTPLSYSFDPEKGVFQLRFQADTSIPLPTEIFVPDFHYGQGFEVQHSKGKLGFDRERSLLLFTPEGGGEQVIIIKRKE